MINLTKRDLDIIETLKKVRVLTSSQMQRIFFNDSQTYQSKRCKKLVNHKKIKVSSLGVWQENIYYLKSKPRQQIKSIILLSEFYTQIINNGFDIKEFKREYYIPEVNIRADGYMICTKNGVEYEFLIEVDLTHSNPYKYKIALENGYLFPELVVISPCRRKYDNRLIIHNINHDFSNMKNFINKLY